MHEMASPDLSIRWDLLFVVLAEMLPKIYFVTACLVSSVVGSTMPSANAVSEVIPRADPAGGFRFSAQSTYRGMQPLTAKRLHRLHLNQPPSFILF
jgi:hypothetical protein